MSTKADKPSQSRLDRDAFPTDFAMLVCSSICLAVTSVALILELVLLRFPHTIRRISKGFVQIFVLYGNLLPWTACTVLALCQIIITHKTNEKCQNTIISSDISGPGIRLALYMPMFLTPVSLLGCLCWSHDFGTKELGVSQLISLAGATLCLWLSFTSLTRVDVIIACVMADALSAVLSMTFSSKEALASRWYIGLSCALQTITYITGGISLGRLTLRTEAQEQPHCCASIAWWGTINACDGPTTNFWIYYALRGVIAAQSACTALRLTRAFDQAKKNVGNPHAYSLPSFEFESLRATVHTDFFRYLPYPFLLAGGLYCYLDDIDPAEIASPRQYGQAIAYLICGSALLHWAYLLGMTCYHVRKESGGRRPILAPNDDPKSRGQIARFRTQPIAYHHIREDLGLGTRNDGSEDIALQPLLNDDDLTTI